MDSERSSRMKVLGDELRAVDKALARLMSKRLSILDQIAKLDAQEGASERQTASRVARLSASTPKQAAGELAMAKQVSALPKLAEAHANGEISNGQLGAVAAIASASSETEALDFAKSATSSQLQQRAAASRGKIFEQRRKALSDRYLGFRPEEDGQSVRIHGRLPFAESNQFEAQLRKIADRLYLGEKDRPSPSARMADALLILTKSNASKALHDHVNSGQSKNEQTDTGNANANANANANGSSPVSAQRSTQSIGSTAKPKLQTVSTTPNRPAASFIDYDEDPFPDTSSQGNEHAYFSEGSDNDGSGIDRSGNDGSSPTDTQDERTVVVQRADTRLIIHWNAQTGSLNFENGPPIDHPRLHAILCDAQIDIQHCDINGLPTGLITTAHHSDWRQDRYLAYRDGPCRIPECQGIGKTQAHHIFEDRVDRTTSVQHMINLCNRCHQNHHDGIFTITGDPEQTITFTYKDCTTLTSNARPLPITLKTPKPTPFAKHQPPSEDLDLFAA
jgi:chorismate mutase